MSNAEGTPLREKTTTHFIESIIIEDLDSGKHQKIVTRFPPEPNGHLHIGHAKAICLNFGLARDNAEVTCNLRFDDTNPVAEDTSYAESIKEDIKWLGFDWGDNLYYASDYFEQLHQYALELIDQGLAYVDEQSIEDIRQQRGSLTEPGQPGPYRDRPIKETKKLFEEMKEGKYPDGHCVLRAKIDMAHPNMNMRDPVIYRIRHVEHHRSGNQWCIYPMYDFTHPLSDALEHITHSLCSLEFEDHRPLYDWCVDHVSVPAKPRQIEFARLNLNYTVMSKRKLLQLVEQGLVSGWDDPRLPTLKGMRRRGYPAKAIRQFCDYISIGKKNTIIDYGLLEQFVRDELNSTAKRFMGVLDPIEVEITNWPENKIEEFEIPLHPQDETFGTRTIKMGSKLFIERTDFLEEPPSPKKWFRLGPDRSVRLRYGPVITCKSFEKDEQGKITKLVCEYVQGSFGGKLPEGMKKVKGIIHWVDKNDSIEVPVHLYDRLFSVENPDGDKSKEFTEFLNPDSQQTIQARVTKDLLELQPESAVQFERMGYFCVDRIKGQQGQFEFNKVVGLKDTWAQKK
jgi:glutaminyl-tRNA synthetase